MTRFARELNAAVAIAAREIMHSMRSPVQLIASLIFPVIFMGILGGSLAQNLGAATDFNLLQFILFGMVVSSLYQVTMNSLVSLIEDRENDFTQEIFVAPISRYSIIMGKIVGGMFASLVSVLGVFLVAIIMQIPMSWADIGHILLMWPVISLAGGALGVMFISLVKDARTAGLGQLLVIFPQMFLAGIMIPVNNSSGVLGFLSHLMPLTYLADLTRAVIYSGRPEYNSIVLFNPALDLFITVAVTVAFFVAGTLIFTRSERTR